MSEQFSKCIMVRTSYIFMRWYEIRFVLNQHGLLDLYSARSLKNCPMVDMSLQLDTLTPFWVDPYLLFLLNPAFVALKQQISILFSLVWPDRGFEPTIYRNRGEHVNNYTTDVVNKCIQLWPFIAVETDVFLMFLRPH